MASRFRNAVVALHRAEAEPTTDNVERAVFWCRQAYAHGGSLASSDMYRKACELAVVHAPAVAMAEG